VTVASLLLGVTDCTIAVAFDSPSEREEEIPAIFSNSAKTAAVSSDGFFLAAAAWIGAAAEKGVRTPTLRAKAAMTWPFPAPAAARERRGRAAGAARG
jgi:hypothetical protein